MLFTDEGWQECKVGRVFKADLKADLKAGKPAERHWQMKQSEYVAHKGTWQEFAQAFERLLPPASACEPVFVTDGAVWISQWVSAVYPKAVQILEIGTIGGLLSSAILVLFILPAIYMLIERRRLNDDD
jgi:hypothetical protein